LTKKRKEFKSSLNNSSNLIKLSLCKIVKKLIKLKEFNLKKINEVKNIPKEGKTR